jgi:chromate transporter
MRTVYPPSPSSQELPAAAFVRASTLHIGAAAGAAALRRDLVERGSLRAHAFDEAYAVARLTPGTNLLAMYALLGERFARLKGAIVALSIGAIAPSVIAIAFTWIYLRFADSPLTARVMQGARAGALAVFAWAVVRLIRPQLERHRWRGVAMALATVGVALLLPLPSFIVLLAMGLIGPLVLRDQP